MFRKFIIAVSIFSLEINGMELIKTTIAQLLSFSPSPTELHRACLSGDMRTILAARQAYTLHTLTLPSDTEQFCQVLPFLVEYTEANGWLLGMLAISKTQPVPDILNALSAKLKSDPAAFKSVLNVNDGSPICKVRVARLCGQLALARDLFLKDAALAVTYAGLGQERLESVEQLRIVGQIESELKALLNASFTQRNFPLFKSICTLIGHYKVTLRADNFEVIFDSTAWRMAPVAFLQELLPRIVITNPGKVAYTLIEARNFPLAELMLNYIDPFFFEKDSSLLMHAIRGGQVALVKKILAVCPQADPGDLKTIFGFCLTPPGFTESDRVPKLIYGGCYIEVLQAIEKAHPGSFTQDELTQWTNQYKDIPQVKVAVGTRTRSFLESKPTREESYLAPRANYLAVLKLVLASPKGLSQLAAEYCECFALARKVGDPELVNSMDIGRVIAKINRLGAEQSNLMPAALLQNLERNKFPVFEDAAADSFSFMRDLFVSGGFPSDECARIFNRAMYFDRWNLAAALAELPELAAEDVLLSAEIVKSGHIKLVELLVKKGVVIESEAIDEALNWSLSHPLSPEKIEDGATTLGSRLGLAGSLSVNKRFAARRIIQQQDVLSAELMSIVNSYYPGSFAEDLVEKCGAKAPQVRQAIVDALFKQKTDLMGLRKYDGVAMLIAGQTGPIHPEELFAYVKADVISWLHETKPTAMDLGLAPKENYEAILRILAKTPVGKERLIPIKADYLSEQAKALLGSLTPD